MKEEIEALKNKPNATKEPSEDYSQIINDLRSQRNNLIEEVELVKKSFNTK